MSIVAPAPALPAPSSRTGSHDRRAMALALLVSAQAHLAQAAESLADMAPERPEVAPLPPEHTEQ